MKTLAIAAMALALILPGCANQSIVGKPKPAVVFVEVVDDYIRDCGPPLPPAVGCTEKVGESYFIRVSRQSVSEIETLQHEMKHVALWIAGLPASWPGH